MRHKKLSLLALLIVFGTLIIIASYTSFYENVYDKYKGKHIRELKDKGVKYIENNEPDSALACFMIVMSRYSEDMSVEDKQICTKAFNNAGYVYTLMYSDYPAAYRYLLRALEIAKSIDFNEQYPLIYINLGNIYIYFEDLKNAAAFYIDAYHAAKDIGNAVYVNHAIENVLLTMRTAMDKDELSDLISDYLSTEISNDPASTFTKELCGVTKDFIEGNATPTHQMTKIDTLINHGKLDVRNLENLRFLKYEIMLDNGQYRPVLNSLISKLRKGNITTGDRAIMLKGISSVYKLMGMEDSAKTFELKSLHIRDSLMHQQNYATIRDMHSSYELDKFERNLTASEHKRKNLANLLIIGGIWIVLLSIGITIIIKKNKRLNETLQSLYNKTNLPPDPLPDTNCNREISSQSNLSNELTEEEQPRHALDEETRKQIADEILKAMKDISIISQCEFTVRKLAELIGMKERYVSYVINESFNCNFNSLLNTHRIAEAKRILSDPAQARRVTIEGLAISLGFKSRSNFTSIFKKESGLTPKEFRKIAETRS